MTLAIKRVALLASNPAFADLITPAVKAEAGYLVFCFASLAALQTFARVSPIDLIIIDDESVGPDLGSALMAVKDPPGRAGLEPKVMLLTRAAPAFFQGLLARGVDAVERKPVSPARLLAAVDEALYVAPSGPMVDGVYRGPERRRSHGRMRAVVAAVGRDNVVPLFAARREEA